MKDSFRTLNVLKGAFMADRHTKMATGGPLLATPAATIHVLAGDRT